MNNKNKIFLLLVLILVASMLWPNKTKEDVISTEIQKPVIIIPEELQKISWCESQNRQFNDDGSIHRGVINPKDIGKYQINEYWNGEKAIRLGFDIYTLEGNTSMALYLYDHQGSTPWNWSKNCWSDTNRVWYKNADNLWSK